MKLKAKIRDRKKEWIEEFDVPKNVKPKTYIQDIVKNFNATLKPGESPRKFVNKVSGKSHTL